MAALTAVALMALDIESMREGQAQPITTGLIALGCWGMARGRWWTAAGALGLSVAIKPLAAAGVWLMLTERQARRYGVAASVLVVALLLVCGYLPEYLHAMGDGRIGERVAASGNLSLLHGFLVVGLLPSWALPLVGLGTGVLLRQRKAPWLVAVVLASFVGSPIVWTWTLTMLLPVGAYVLGRWFEQHRSMPGDVAVAERDEYPSGMVAT